MNLYKIKVKHYSQKDSLESILSYAVAENDNSIYEFLKSEPEINGDKHRNSFRYDEDLDDEYLDNEGKTYKEYMIELRGQFEDDYQSYDDLYYGLTLHAWELVRENIDVESVKHLVDITGIDIIFLPE